MSLRTRLVALVAVVLVLGVLLGSILAGYEARRTLQDELRAGLLGGQQTVLSAFEDLPRSDHAERDLHQLIATFNGNRHVRARLVNARGTVFLTSTRSAVTEPAPGWFSSLLSVPSGELGIDAPLPVTDRRIVLSTIADIDQAGVWAEFRVIFGALILAAAVALVFVHLATTAALRPLMDLAAGFIRIGSGDYSVRVATPGPSELLDLQYGFNAMADRLAEVSRRNRALEDQLITLQDEERADLARDLHDEIGPHLFAVSLEADGLGRIAGAKAKAQIASIQASVRHMQGLVRDILGRLRPSRATELGLNPAIQDLAVFWTARASGLAIACDLPDDEPALDEVIKDTLYRIAQESLSNAVRHAAATRIEVRLGLPDSGVVEMSIHDNGDPAAPVAEGGFGLLGMRERVKACQGTLTLAPAGALGGWSVTARLPVRASLP